MVNNLSTARFSADGIPYRLLEGYPKFNVDDDKTTATEKYLLNASDIQDFADVAMPPPTIVGNRVVLPPRRLMPGTTNLFTKSIAFEPHTGMKPGDPFVVDAAAPAGTYDPFYVATIQYEASLFGGQEQDPTKPETFLEHTVQIGGEFLQIPPNKTQLEKGDVDKVSGADEGGGKANKNLIQPIVITIPTVEHTLKWKYALNPDFDKILSYLGKVNSKKIELFFNAKKETVLFLGVSGSRQYQWAGRRINVLPWSLDFRFSQRHIEESGEVFGWNHVYDPDSGEWKKLYRANGRPLHQRRDLFSMFD